MSQKNHIFVSDLTDLNELQSTIRAHEDTVSYLKVASVCVKNVDIKRLCDMVRGSAISVCIGGGVAEREAEKTWSHMQRTMGEDLAVLRALAQKWATAIEFPVFLLNHPDIPRLAQDFFQKRLIEIGVKDDPSHRMNSPKVMMEGVQSAQSFGADHIILEGSVIGDCGIYSANQVANVLLVDTLMEQIQDASRCIIEWPQFHQQDLWRAIYGPEAHIGNIHNLRQVNAPSKLEYTPEYWTRFRIFRKRLQDITEKNGLSWDNIARDERTNLDMIDSLPEIEKKTDEELAQYLQKTTYPEDVRLFMDDIVAGLDSKLIIPISFSGFSPGTILGPNGQPIRIF